MWEFSFLSIKLSYVDTKDFIFVTLIQYFSAFITGKVAHISSVLLFYELESSLWALLTLNQDVCFIQHSASACNVEDT